MDWGTTIAYFLGNLLVSLIVNALDIPPEKQAEAREKVKLGCLGLFVLSIFACWLLSNLDKLLLH
jgi:hypothetical protein